MQPLTKRDLAVSRFLAALCSCFFERFYWLFLVYVFNKIRILIGSSRCLRLLWLVRVIYTWVRFVATLENLETDRTELKSKKVSRGSLKQALLFCPFSSLSNLRQCSYFH